MGLPHSLVCLLRINYLITFITYEFPSASYFFPVEFVKDQAGRKQILLPMVTLITSSVALALCGDSIDMAPRGCFDASCIMTYHAPRSTISGTKHSGQTCDKLGVVLGLLTYNHLLQDVLYFSATGAAGGYRTSSPICTAS
jgi:hypothetical protein